MNRKAVAEYTKSKADGKRLVDVANRLHGPYRALQSNADSIEEAADVIRTAAADLRALAAGLDRIVGRMPVDPPEKKRRHSARLKL